MKNHILKYASFKRQRKSHSGTSGKIHTDDLAVLEANIIQHRSVELCHREIAGIERAVFQSRRTKLRVRQIAFVERAVRILILQIGRKFILSNRCMFKKLIHCWYDKERMLHSRNGCVNIEQMFF